ncbi:hypothetical protein [Noviherbaspirillum massiliense]|uniref:hypothetical protein n=1 Tax=Noviherbaspirillum massiliense TaxID=1465823 RepID=UPI0011DD632B|nr:hypothetical protein [Noviherbaspirillum massiliense]
MEYIKGGVKAGVFWGQNGKELEVRLYPGERDSGLFFYTLKETGRTRMDEVKDTVSEGLNTLGKALKQALTHGPFAPPMPTPPRGPALD